MIEMKVILVTIDNNKLNVVDDVHENYLTLDLLHSLI